MLSILCAAYLIARHPKQYEDCDGFVIFLVLGFIELMFEGSGLMFILGAR